MQPHLLHASLGSFGCPPTWLDKSSLVAIEPPAESATVGPSLVPQRQFRANIVVNASYPTRHQPLGDNSARLRRDLLGKLPKSRLIADGEFSFSDGATGCFFELAYEVDGLLLSQHYALRQHGTAVFVLTTTCDAGRWPRLKAELLECVASFRPGTSAATRSTT